MSDKKKRPQAAALQYDSNKDAAPLVTAKGKGLIAEKIIELAKKNHIPIKNDPTLVELLSKLEINTQIPGELYQAVAEILAFLYKINAKKKETVSIDSAH